MSKKRFSILVPTTDEDGASLGATLRTCIAQEFEDFEVVVASSGNKEAAQKTVGDLASPFIRAVHSSQLLGRGELWDFAIENSLGEYVTILADGGGLLFHALREIDLLLRQLHTKAITWERAYFHSPSLPGQPPTAADSLWIPLRRGDAGSPLHKRDAKTTLQAAANLEIPASVLPGIHSSMVRRSLLDEVRARAATAFKRGPDSFSGYAIAWAAGSYHVADIPMGIHAYSGKEPGAAALLQICQGKPEEGVRTPTDDKLQANRKTVSSSVVNARAFLDAKAVFFPFDDGLALDHKKLVAACMAGLSLSSAEVWQEIRESIRASVKDFPALLSALDAETASKSYLDFASSPKQEPRRYDGSYLRLDAAQFEIRDVFEAAEFCEKLLGYRCDGVNWNTSPDPTLTPVRLVNAPQKELFHQDADLALLTAILKTLENKVVIDVGAQRGSFAEAFLEAGADTVFVLEAYPPNVQHLREKFTGEARVKIFDGAVGECDRPVKLRIASNHNGELLEFHHTIQFFPDSPTVCWKSELQVQCRSLDSMTATGELPPTAGILKIDSEGNDYAVIRGIGSLSADVIMAEFWGNLPHVYGKCPFALADLHRELQPRGYSNYLVIKRRDELQALQFNDSNTRPEDWGNVIYVHDRVFSKVAPLLCSAISETQDALMDKALEFRAICEHRMDVIKGVKRTADDRLQVINTVTQAAEERLRAITALAEALERERRGNELRSSPLPMAPDGLSVAKPWLDPSNSASQSPDLARRLAESNALLAHNESIIARLNRECYRLRRMVGEEGSVPRLSAMFTAIVESLKRRTLHPFLDANEMQIGILRQYDPRPLRSESFPAPATAENELPDIAMVTPSYMQAAFLERTILSVTAQGYPKLRYWIQDGGSRDASMEIVKRRAPQLAGWESIEDAGQASAIARGFLKCKGDIMAWLNSDDMLVSGSLRYVGEYFAAHPEVDVVYGHRLIIDENDQEVGRWVLPRHDPYIMRFADYVPQESLFWRSKLWDKVGGLDPSFQFALDWDLIMRFQEAGAKIVRLPYFLGCFRLHPSQKTSASMTNSMGDHEMSRIRERIHGRPIDWHDMGRPIRRYCRRGSAISYLLSLGYRR